MPARSLATAGRGFIAVALVGALMACTTPPGPTQSGSPAPSAAASVSTEPAELAALRARPLRLPTLAAGADCPVTSTVALDPPLPTGHALSTGGAPKALGRAPLFPDGRYFGADGVLGVRAGHPHPGWYTAKTPWASRPGYRGWTLIRTASLDGIGRALVELQLPEGPTVANAVAVDAQADWQFWPGGTEVTNPGCYAYQVDGAGFTEVIVFRAVVVP